MSFEPFVHGRLVVIRLREPTPAVSRAMTDLVEHRHAHLGELLVFAMIIGTDCPMPEPSARRQLAADQARLRSCCASMRSLIFGRELRQTLVRSLITGFSMLPGSMRPEVDTSLAPFLAALERSLGLSGAWLRNQLVMHRLLSAREAHRT